MFKSSNFIKKITQFNNEKKKFFETKGVSYVFLDAEFQKKNTQKNSIMNSFVANRKILSNCLTKCPILRCEWDIRAKDK